ncbi:hypothetical protein GGQ80_000008 [Sphingomonas jinjuensis]|uniref:Uncharacterized protein n=1 Tax=Sphingomonas jinjuensis TaxID=535907 RepID=A0A840F6B7_9SPHN|nr:hypothetical protein [Sphingomonas jinjuensis]MBB4152132.1 hypothetical protein [Sphingomonas jinjuensis]
MRTLLKSSFLWQFTGGFVLGAIGLFALQPASADSNFGHPTTVAHAQR